MSDASFRRHRVQVSLEHAARRVSRSLTPELVTSIRTLAPTFPAKRIPQEHAEELERLNLAKRRFGRTRLTPLGRCILLL